MLPYINIPVVFPTSTTVAMIATATTTAVAVPDVPFYSQFEDIQSSTWQKKGCGVTSLAMLIEYYKPGTVEVNTLLKQAIASGAYLPSAGWKHRDLALLSKKYGLTGMNYDYANVGKDIAFAELRDALKEGPVMASIYYKFDPKSPIPHLVVINGIDGDTIYYNDPADKTGGKQISTANFLKGWKKRFIVVREVPNKEIILAKK